jgi:hypothetical protein
MEVVSFFVSFVTAQGTIQNKEKYSNVAELGHVGVVWRTVTMYVFPV